MREHDHTATRAVHNYSFSGSGVYDVDRALATRAREVASLLKGLEDHRGGVAASFNSVSEAERERPGVRQIVVRVSP